MKWTTDKKNPKKCLVCGQVSYRVNAGEYPGLGEFAIPALITLDKQRSFGEESPDRFPVIMYMCSKCNHLDFYGIRIGGITP